MKILLLLHRFCACGCLLCALGMLINAILRDSPHKGFAVSALGLVCLLMGTFVVLTIKDKEE